MRVYTTYKSGIKTLVVLLRTDFKGEIDCYYRGQRKSPKIEDRIRLLTSYSKRRKGRSIAGGESVINAFPGARG
jgi:hypothetical protein